MYEQTKAFLKERYGRIVDGIVATESINNDIITYTVTLGDHTMTHQTTVDEVDSCIADYKDIMYTRMAVKVLGVALYPPQQLDVSLIIPDR